MIKQPIKTQIERQEILHREGWELEPAASVFTNDEKSEVAVVLLDGRYFRGTVVERPMAGFFAQSSSGAG